MAELSTQALVLRHADYGDYDRMVTLFTPEYGRIDAIARGCRRPKSELVNAVEPFVCGDFQLFFRKDRYTIDQCRIRESFYGLRTDYDRLRHGVYWLKLLEAGVMPEEPNERLFLMTLRALAYLEYSDDLPLELITLAFEMHLMAELGFAPCMHACLQCGRPIDGDARFDVGLGGAVCLACLSAEPKISNGARRILMKAPRTDFDKFVLLKDRPEWPEAAERFREYINDRLGQEKYAPELFEKF